MKKRTLKILKASRLGKKLGRPWVVATFMLACAMVAALVGCAGGESTQQTGGLQQAGKAASARQHEPQYPEIIPKEQSTATTPEERAQEILSCMNLRQKVGQLILARCPGANQAEALQRYQLGGYVLYERDFFEPDGTPKTAQAVQEMVHAYQSAPVVAPFLAVDEEGGTVVRASSNENLFPEGAVQSPQEILASGGEEALYADARAKSEGLVRWGLNLNLAPVADVATSEGAFMYDRSMGTDAQTTARLVGGVVREMKAAGIASTLKHFPGYGNAGDTHSTSASDTRSLEDFQTQDFLPFAAGIEAGADCVMTSHVFVESIDPDNPASLSPEAHRILREDLGFEGVIITDDLWMLAGEANIQTDDAAVLAILAGNDMIISTTFETDMAKLSKAVRDGDLSEERLDESVLRILKLKLALGLME